MWTRSLVRPTLVPVERGWDLRAAAPRQAWTAVIGPGPIAAYLRLREAAIRKSTMRRPPQLTTLLEERIVIIHRGQLLVPSRAPALTVDRLRSSSAGRLLLGG